jgi:hypothetical protein
MTSEISSRAACLAELISNPKSFFNCPDLHGGSGLPEAARSRDPGDGRWEMGDGRWEMGDGRWEMGDGRRERTAETLKATLRSR